MELWLQELIQEGYKMIYKPSKASNKKEFYAVRTTKLTDDTDVYVFELERGEHWITNKKDSKDIWINITR